MAYYSLDGTTLIVETAAPRQVAEAHVNYFARQRGVDRVTVRHEREVGHRPSAGIVGGAQLNTFQNLPACTSAFSIVNTSGQSQLLTAGHCGNLLKYGSNSWLYEANGESVGFRRDIQCHATSQTPLPKFQFAPGKLTTNKAPTGYRPILGAIYSRYGRHTNETIRVKANNASWSDSQFYVDGLWISDVGSKVIPGDSGGPWWVGAPGGAYAVGITSGCHWGSGETCVNGTSKMVSFTGADEVPIYMAGWKFMTG